MVNVAKHLTELIGDTPMVEISNYETDLRLNATLIGKMESFNPMGSVKDRVAEALIEQGIADGKIDPSTVIIEPTSGNTGIGLAFATAVEGLRLILTMPDTMSVERRKIVTALGAEIVLTPGKDGMKAAIAKANELKEEIGNAFIPQQFENKANLAIHRNITAEEIWRDTLRGSKILQKKIFETKNITFLPNYEVNEICGEKKVEKIILHSNISKENRELEVSGVFIAVGMLPQSDLVQGLVERDSAGYVLAGEDCRTSHERIYAAGDVRTKGLRQVVTAVADGAIAVNSVEQDNSLRLA